MARAEPSAPAAAREVLKAGTSLSPLQQAERIEVEMQRLSLIAFAMINRKS